MPRPKIVPPIPSPLTNPTEANMPRPKIVPPIPSPLNEAPREATVRLVQGRMEKLLDAVDNLKDLLTNRLPLLYPEDWDDISTQLHASVEDILSVQHTAGRPRFQLRRHS